MTGEYDGGENAGEDSGVSKHTQKIRGIEGGD